MPAYRTTALLALAIAAVLAAPVFADERPPAAPAESPARTQLAMRCFAQESRVSGTSRICYYRCAGTNMTSMTIPANDLCPIFIDR